ncbi:hypothetical protein, partial [Pseudomonas syringae]
SMLNSASFSIEYGSGVESIGDELGIQAFKYHQQNEVIDNIIDVYGDSQQNFYLQYINFKFYLVGQSDGAYQVFIESPPKGLRQFVSTLRRAFSMAFSFDAVKLNVYDWYKRFQSFPGITRVRILKAQSSVMNINTESSFRIAVESSADAIAQMENIVAGRRLSLDRLKLSFFFKNNERVIELSSSFSLALAGWGAVDSLNFIMSVTSFELTG